MANRKRILPSFIAVLIALCFIMPVGIIGNFGEGETSKVTEGDIKYDFKLYLKTGAFDPLKEEPNIPANLKLMNENGYYIVQVNGAVTKEYKEEIERAGAYIHDYVPNSAWLVSMSRATKTKVSKLPFVRWIGNFEPAYKISPGLNEKEGDVKVNILLFKEPSVEPPRLTEKDVMEHLKETMGAGTDSSFTSYREEAVKGEELKKNRIPSDGVVRVEDLESLKKEEKSSFSLGKIKDLEKETGILQAGINEDRVLVNPQGQRMNALRDLKLKRLGKGQLIQKRNGLISAQDIIRAEVVSRIEAAGGKITWAGESKLVAKIDASMIPTIAFIPEVYYIEEHFKPEPLMTEQRQTIGCEPDPWETTNHPHAAGFDGDHADSYSSPKGDREVVTVYVLTGCDVDHPEFERASRMVAIWGNPDYDKHGSVCLGIMAAAGIDEDAKGIVPDAGWCIGNFYDMDTYIDPDTDIGISLTPEQIAANAKSKYSIPISVSWGVQIGPEYGNYTSESREFDYAMYNHSVIFFIGDGNEAPMGPMPGSCSKNCMCVGGLNSQGTGWPEDDIFEGAGACMGPTNDGRMKPDIAGDFGVYGIMCTDRSGPSGYSGGDYMYDFAGTSACAPEAAGTAALYIDMWNANHFGNSPSALPSSACLKALMIANAYQLPMSSAARYEQGWGEVNCERAYQLGSRHLIVEESTALNTSNSETYTVKALGDVPLKITLVWTEPPGALFVTKELVNDLDLEVKSLKTGETYYGNLGLDNDRWNKAGTGINAWTDNSNSNESTDDLNNVENVFIQYPEGEYKITVRASEATSQKYALVASGVASGTGQLHFDIVPFYGYGSIGKVTVVDADLNTNPNLVENTGTSVKITSKKDTTGFTMTLYETGKDTGTFTGYLNFSRDEPEGVNTMGTYPENNVIDVFPEDTITATYNDASPKTTVTTTATYDRRAPVISNVSITDVTYSSFTVEYDTDEPAIGYLFMYVVDTNKTDYDEMWNDWEYSGSDPHSGVYGWPATLTDIRDHNVTGAWGYYDGTPPRKHHEFWVPFMYPNLTILFMPAAVDLVGNVMYDENAGNFYNVTTFDQPFDILIVNDDKEGDEYGYYYSYPGYLLDWDGLMFAGYYPLVCVPGYNATDDWNDYDWDGSCEFCSYDDHFVNVTLNDYWNGMCTATQAGVKNIVIWDTGTTCSDLAVCSKDDADGTGAAKRWDDWGGFTVNATDISKIKGFLDKGGNMVFFGDGWWEDANDRAAVKNFMKTYMHADIKASSDGSGTTVGKAVGYDVGTKVMREYMPPGGSAGDERITLNIKWNGKMVADYGYLWINGTAGEGARVSLPGDSFLATSFSGDEITTIVGDTGAVLEYDWGGNMYNGADNANYYSAISYEGTNKTFYSSAGEDSFSVYLYFSGDINNLIEVFKRLVKWMAPDDYINRTSVSGNVKVGASNVVNATVHAFMPGDKTNVIAGALTDVNGNYNFNITPGTYDIYAFKEGYAFDSLSNVNVVLGGVTGKNLVLGTDVRTISGTVKVDDPFWGPRKIKYAYVKAEGPVTKTVWSGSEGAYIIKDLPPGVYNVTAYDERWINASHPYYGCESNTTTGVDVSTSSATGIDFTMRTGSLSGAVFDSSGKPLKFVCLEIVENGSEFKYENILADDFVFSEDGSYSFWGLSTGYYDIKAYRNGYWYVIEYIGKDWVRIFPVYGYFNKTIYNVYVETGNETANVNITMDSSLGWINGTLTPAACGAKVRIKLTSPEEMVGLGGTEVTTYTDLNGKYSVPVPEGTYQVDLKANGYVRQRVSKTVNAGATTNGDFTLTAGECIGDILFMSIWNYDKNVENKYGKYGKFNHMFTDSMDNNGYFYDTWNITYITPDGHFGWAEPWSDGFPDEYDLYDYDIVLYTCADDPHYYFSPGYILREPFCKFMKKGGSLFVSSYEWLYWTVFRIYGYAPDSTMTFFYYSEYKKGDSDGNAEGVAVKVPMKKAKGYAGNPISDPWSGTAKSLVKLDSPPFKPYEDILRTNTSKGGLYVFDGANGPAAIMSNGTQEHRALWFGFPFERFSQTAGVVDSDTNKLMKNMVEWFNVRAVNTPILSGGGVSPETGSGDGSYTYWVNYTDLDGDAPDYVKVTIDLGLENEATYEMTQVTGGTDYQNGKAFNYTLTTGLSQGEHTFRFSTSDGTGGFRGIRYKETGLYDGPTINDIEPPTITFIPHTTVGLNERIVINATIKDNVVIKGARVYYRMGTEGEFESRNMRLSGNQLNPDDYLGVIPGQTSPGTLYYYLWATDGTNPPVIDDNSTAYYKVTVVGVEPPKVLVKAPNGGETLPVGGTFDINWSASQGTDPLAPSPITIKYSNDSGANWKPIASGIANTPPFSWTIPDDPSTTCLVKVEAVDINGVVGSDVSNGTFTITSGIPETPTGAKGSVSGNDYIVSWDAVTGVDGYRVYNSTNRFTAWSSWNVLGTTTLTSYTHTGEAGRPGAMYYIVRSYIGATESNNSTIVVKMNVTFTLNVGATNVNWISLPYNSSYKKASNIVTAIEGGTGSGTNTKINTVALWDPAGQSAIGYSYSTALKKWIGTDFDIAAGSGVYLGITSSFNWVVNGTDISKKLSFTLNVGATNVNWISTPYTMMHNTTGATALKAHDIVSWIEGGTGSGTNTKINTVALWDPAGQSAIGYSYSTALKKWIGTDFEITPGSGVYLGITSSFTWTPELVQ